MTPPRPKLLPDNANNAYAGRQIVVVVFAFITLVTLVRSLIHLLSADGGAQSIASIPLDTFSAEAAGAVIFTFSVWGLSQLLMGVVYGVVLLKYRSLIPLMYVLIAVEYAARIAIGAFKPVVTESTAPGEIGNYIMIPLGIVMLALSLMPRQDNRP